MNELQERCTLLAPRAAALHGALQAEIDKLAWPPPAPVVAPLAQAECRLERDPASGEDSLSYTWRDRHGHRTGMLLLHADGSFFGEFDVVRPHPGRPGWFVEAVTAWGRDAVIKAEPRLLQMAT